MTPHDHSSGRSCRSRILSQLLEPAGAFVDRYAPGQRFDVGSEVER